VETAFVHYDRIEEGVKRVWVSKESEKERPRDARRETGKRAGTVDPKYYKDNFRPSRHAFIQASEPTSFSRSDPGNGVPHVRRMPSGQRAEAKKTISARLQHLVTKGEESCDDVWHPPLPRP
jgi:hypothetical protein